MNSSKAVCTFSENTAMRNEMNGVLGHDSALYILGRGQPGRNTEMGFSHKKYPGRKLSEYANDLRTLLIFFCKTEMILRSTLKITHVPGVMSN